MVRFSFFFFELFVQTVYKIDEKIVGIMLFKAFELNKTK